MNPSITPVGCGANPAVSTAHANRHGIQKPPKTKRACNAGPFSWEGKKVNQVSAVKRCLFVLKKLFFQQMVGMGSALDGHHIGSFSA